MSAAMEMPRYKCHKEVRALQIRKIAVHRVGDAITKVVLTPDDERYEPFDVTPEYWHKHNPKPLGYYVVYADGYASFSPEKAFEEGYTLVE